jgi:hypothetical protein
MAIDRGSWDITLYKNRDFVMPVYFRDINNDPIDLTGWTGVAQIRETAKPDSPLIMNLTVTVADATAGKVVITGDKADTKVCQDTGRWDLVMTNADGKSDSYLIGNATFITVPTVQA